MSEFSIQGLVRESGEPPLAVEVPWPENPMDLCRAMSESPFGFFLDSGADIHGLGRYSFLGCEPYLVFRCFGDRIEIRRGNGISQMRTDPFEAMKALMAEATLAETPDLPPFTGGAVGYFGYDLRLFVEELPDKNREDVGLPDAFFGFYDALLALDHRRNRAWAISTGLPETAPARRARRARERLEWLQALRSRPISAPRHPGPSALPRALRCNFARSEYEAAVRRAKEYIAAGDIFQVNLSQRFSAPVGIPPLVLYDRLRRINPEPFAAFLWAPDHAVASASPERFLRFDGDRVETRPIKGTRPRGTDPATDRALREELLASPKDRAENVMIVDLERNDLGRFCRYGSIRVPELVICEAHPTVFHLVSTIEGRIAPGYDRIDCIRSCFPGGSITGAPKVRAMQIIDELEPTRRGLYTGAIGYLGLNGQVDLNIAIRTFVLKDGMAHFQVGGGIVADSDPAGEYQETLDKARALFEALGSGGLS